MDEATNKRLGELIMQLADGDVGALDGIAMLIERILRAIGNIYYKNKADVEDAIHDLYMKLFRTAKNFRVNKNASAWIIRMYENDIKTSLHLRQKETEFLQEDPFLYTTAQNTVDVYYIENYVFLHEIIDRLNNDERRLIIYYHWCKCTVREVAHILRKSKSCVSMQLKKLEEKVKNL